MSMADVLFIVLMVAFFGLAVLLVRVCDRIIGADDDIIIGADDVAEPEELAA